MNQIIRDTVQRAFPTLAAVNSTCRPLVGTLRETRISRRRLQT